MLNDNEPGLRHVYDESWTPRDGFKQADAYKLITDAFRDQDQIEVTAEEMKKCFVYSKMTVKVEYKHRKQYDQLVYVEFLEYLCRIALFAFGAYEPGLFSKEKAIDRSDDDLPIQLKVYEVLRLVFAHQAALDAEKEAAKKKSGRGAGAANAKDRPQRIKVDLP